MKKLFYICIGLAIASIGLFLVYLQPGRESEFADYEISEPLLFNPALTDVNLVIRNVMENELRATLTNDTDYLLSPHHAFGLEFFDGENWRVVPWRDGGRLITADLPLLWQNETQHPRYCINGFLPLPPVDLL